MQECWTIINWLLSLKQKVKLVTQSAGIVEFAHCFSAKGRTVHMHKNELGIEQPTMGDTPSIQTKQKSLIWP